MISPASVSSIIYIMLAMDTAKIAMAPHRDIIIDRLCIIDRIGLAYIMMYK